MFKKSLVVVGTLMILAAIFLVACGTTATPEVTEAPATTAPPATEAAPAAPVADVPFISDWQASGHADINAEPFSHWNSSDPAVVPTACARCHTPAGFVEYAGTGAVAEAIPAPAGVINCSTCHSSAARALRSVTFPSGKVVETSAKGEAVCMTCHQGRESKVSVDKQINETFKVTDMDAVVAPITDDSGKKVNFGFINIHYFAAGATLYGSQAQAGYEYDGNIYDPKFRHVDEFDTCLACHDQHATKVRVEACAECHEGVKTVDDLKNNRMNGSLVDYNGNGDTKEGIYYELKGMQDALYSAIQAYATETTKTPIVYSGDSYPYFFVADADGNIVKDSDGKTTSYNAWSARLLKAAYNYQLSVKDPGAFAHNAKYVMELLYDSIADLNTKLAKPIDMSKMHRDDAGHFAGNTEPFRHWDSEGEVAAGCAKCHSATGLPVYLANNGTEVVTPSGIQITGIVGQPLSNGFACATCHDTANFPNRRAAVNVPFPNGKSLTFSTEKDDKDNLKPVDANLCIECHQGRESTVTVNNYLAGKDADTVDAKISFRNVHYFAAGATLFGDAAQGAYQYTDKAYAGQNLDHPLNKCTDCHDVHALNVKTDTCKGCHSNVNGVEDLENIRFASDTTDWNGNGDTTEGIAKEIDAFRSALYAVIQKYAVDTSKTPIVYDAGSYPYFFVADANGDKAKDDSGNAVRFNAWTPRLLKAAYNYQYSLKDPGVFAHNPKYVMQFMYDSIKDLGGDVSKLTRPEVAK